jgi:hypothetical protein
MPYDYLWQFLSYPITNTEFETGKLLPVKNQKYFDFEREITKAEMQNEEQQLIMYHQLELKRTV